MSEVQASLEAALLLHALFSLDSTDGQLQCLNEDPFIAGLDIDQLEASQLVELIRIARQRLSLLQGSNMLHIRITRDLRILLPEQDGREIVLKPLCKVLFLLFLAHPEGIDFKHIARYEDEIMSYYQRISRRLDSRGMKDSVHRILNPDSNCLNTYRTALARALEKYIDPEMVGQYVIGGRKGEKHAIALDRAFVHWD